MIQDLAAVLAGFCLFSLIAFLPGYALGWLTNVLRFRARSLPFRFAASAPLAIAVGPVVAFTVGCRLSLSAVLLLYIYACVVALFLIALDLLRAPRRLPREWFPLLALFAVWLTIASLSLIDLQFHGREYFSIIAFDYSIRIPITESIGAFGLPAQSPFFFPGHPALLRYHYFWMILCALAAKLGGNTVTVRQTFIAGTLWAGIALMCLVPLYLLLFSSKGRANLPRRTFIGICLLGVTGLDILPAVMMLFLEYTGLMRGISPSVEWWNNQVDGWLYTMLWEPHYICALVACLAGFLVLWETPADARFPRRLLNAIIAGLAFSSSVGAGIYMSIVFAVFLAAWTLTLAARKRFSEAAAFVAAGVIAGGLAIPFLRTLASSKGSGGSFLQLTFRSFEPVEMFLRIFRLDRPWLMTLGNVVMLPLNYLLEFGVFFIVGYLVCRRLWSNRRSLGHADLAALLMAGASLLICTFVRSGVIANNDLGWRGFLFCQFVLLLWAADLFPDLNTIQSRAKKYIGLFLALGALGVVYDLGILRFYPPLFDAGMLPGISWLSDDQKLGERTAANRAAFDWLRSRTPPDITIQQNPEVLQDNFYGIYGRGRTLSGGKDCLTTFGGDPKECASLTKQIDPLFNSRDGSLETACRALPFDVFIVKDTDAVWRDKTSWVWRSAPEFHNEFVRMFFCPRLK